MTTIIQYLDHLPKDLEDKMVEGFVAYESSHGIDVNYQKFALIMTNQQEELIGVLNAYTCFSEVYVQDFGSPQTIAARGTDENS